MTALEKLIDISISIATDHTGPLPSIYHLRGLEILLSKRNGFFAFESALMVLPTLTIDFVPSIQDWNDPNGWRRRYHVASDVIFFGMDVFAGQFGIRGDEIVLLDPERGVSKLGGVGEKTA